LFLDAAYKHNGKRQITADSLASGIKDANNADANKDKISPLMRNLVKKKKQDNIKSPVNGSLKLVFA